MILEIRNLSVSYGKKEVLRGINLELYKGETLAVVGESGAGKTTLGLTVAGLIGRESTSTGRNQKDGRVQGSILYRDRDILSLPEGELRKLRWNRISFVFQNVTNALNPVLPVIDQVAEPVVEHGLGSNRPALERARSMLELVGFPENKSKNYPHQLSGGELQRVLLAMALVNNPEVLILDEPTASLDPIIRKEIIALLKKIAENCAVLLITHDLAAASLLSDRTAVLYKGRILEEGLTEKVLYTPHHPYMRALLRSYPNMTTTKDIQAIKHSQENTDRGCPFAARCTQALDICRNSVPELKELSVVLNTRGGNGVERNRAAKVACHRGGIVPYLVTYRLKKKYNRSFTLEDISFILFEGETVALVGQSGSGKSTIAKIIMGLDPPDDGKILLEEKPLPAKRPKDFYRKVQMIFQNPYDAVSRRMTVREVLTEPLVVQKAGNTGEFEEKAKKVLQEVGLPDSEDFLESYPHSLSGGELQRLAIARALILDPKLLIADEPTSALDALVQARILKMLMSLQEQRGLGMLFITHDIALARKIADRIIVIRDGRLVEQGLSREIITSPRDPYTKRLIDSAAEI